MLGKSVCVIGAGASGLITAHTLLSDGLNVQVLTRDKSAGGVWSPERVYPGLQINNVIGEFRFSPLPMPPPTDEKTTGGRLSSSDIQQYLESFADQFLKGHIRYGAEVLKVSQGSDGRWVVKIKDLQKNDVQELIFDKIVLCTGGCSQPFFPPALDPSSAKASNFSGLVLHSQQFSPQLEGILSHVKSRFDDEPGSVVVVGCGRSAQDIAAYLTTQDRKVTMIFETADAFLAAPFPLPYFIRKSRFLGLLSPYKTLRTRLERFLHTTWVGSAITHAIWNSLAWASFLTYSIPKDSPLRKTHSMFWGIRTNDEGVGEAIRFHALATAGQIDLIAPARVAAFGPDGWSVLLQDGRQLRADAVILATGYKSSWDALFDDKTRQDIGLVRQPLDGQTEIPEKWEYASLSNPPVQPGTQESGSSMYRGLVPGKNILRRDFAVNGATFSANNGYTFEVSAHWISSYFLGDTFLRLPPTAEAALAHAQLTSAWLRKRYPGMLAWLNESYSSDIVFLAWPQLADEMLEDMDLPIMRSGGNWLTWPFKVIDLKEVETLHMERANKRATSRAPVVI